MTGQCVSMEIHVSSQEIERLCICLLSISLSFLNLFTIFLLDFWIVNSMWYYILLSIWSQLFNPLLTFAVKSAIPYYFNENYFIAIKQITKKHFYINYLSVSYFTTDKLFWISIIINLNDLSHAPTSKWNLVIWSVR